MSAQLFLATTKEIQVQLPIQQAPHTMTEEVAAFAQMIQQPDQTSTRTGWMMQALFMIYSIPCARLLALDLRQKNENQTTD